MSTDIMQLLHGLNLYLGVPLTAREQEVAKQIYAELEARVKELEARVKELQQECKVARLARAQVAQRYEGPRT